MSEPPTVWLAEATDGRRVVARVGREGDRLIAEWMGLGRLRVGRDGSDPIFEPEPTLTPMQRQKLEQGAVRVLLRSLSGKIGLHGAAVGLFGRAVVLLGRARDGKSTLAAALCARPEGMLLADDAVPLEQSDGWFVLPSEQAHFLDDAAIQALGAVASRERLATEKAAVLAPRVGSSPLPLGTMVRLVFDDACRRPLVRRLSPVDAMATLVPQTIRFAIDEPDRHRAELERLTELVAAVPAYELRRARDFACLAASVECVEGLVDGHS